MISEEELNERWARALIETREMNAAARLMFRQLEAEKDKQMENVLVQLYAIESERDELRAALSKLEPHLLNRFMVIDDGDYEAILGGLKTKEELEREIEGLKRRLNALRGIMQDN